MPYYFKHSSIKNKFTFHYILSMYARLNRALTSLFVALNSISNVDPIAAQEPTREFRRAPWLCALTWPRFAGKTVADRKQIHLP
jgi:hypothetical protein